MLKVIALIATAVIACTAIGTWAAANSRSPERTRAAATAPINPLAVMRAAPVNLTDERFDAH